jgi:hypothetical protein
MSLVFMFLSVVTGVVDFTFAESLQSVHRRERKIRLRANAEKLQSGRLRLLNLI